MKFTIPYITNNCVGCGECKTEDSPNLEGSCPKNALTISEHPYVINIDYDTCIDCGACVDFVESRGMCPVDAIEIKTVEIGEGVICHQ